MKDADIPPSVIRELLGEVQDPRYGIFNAITELSGMTRMSAFFKQILEESNAAQKAGGRGSFWETREAAEEQITDKLKL